MERRVVSVYEDVPRFCNPPPPNSRSYSAKIQFLERKVGITLLWSAFWQRNALKAWLQKCSYTWSYFSVVLSPFIEPLLMNEKQVSLLLIGFVCKMLQPNFLLHCNERIISVDTPKQKCKNVWMFEWGQLAIFFKKFVMLHLFSFLNGLSWISCVKQCMKQIPNKIGNKWPCKMTMSHRGSNSLQSVTQLSYSVF